MKRYIPKGFASLLTPHLTMLAVATFLLRFGQGLFNGVRTNFFVDVLNLSGTQVLWLEGLREVPGLALIFIAAAIMHLPLAKRAAISVFLMGVGYMLYALINSFIALVAIAIIASLGMHNWMPLANALGLCLTTKERSGRVLGALASVGALASIAGIGALALVSGLMRDLSLRSYYLIGGALIVVGGVLIARLPDDVGKTRIEQPRMLLDKRYWLYYVLTFFEGSRKEVLNAFAILLLVERYGLQVWQVSSVLLVSSILNFVMAPVLGLWVDRFGERITLSASYFLLVLCCLAFATFDAVWILVSVLVIKNVLILLGMGLPTYVNRIAPPEELTPTLSAGISINHVTSVAMPLVAGALLPLLDYSGIFIGTAGLIVLSIPFALSMRVKEGETESEGESLAAVAS